jgi:hypothetical protein
MMYLLLSVTTLLTALGQMNPFSGIAAASGPAGRITFVSTWPT